MYLPKLQLFLHRPYSNFLCICKLCYADFKPAWMCFFTRLYVYYSIFGRQSLFTKHKICIYRQICAIFVLIISYAEFGRLKVLPETYKGKSKIINRVALLLMLITADQPFSNGYMRTFIIVPHTRGNSYSHCPTYIQLMYTHKWKLKNVYAEHTASVTDVRTP